MTVLNTKEVFVDVVEDYDYPYIFKATELTNSQKVFKIPVALFNRIQTAIDDLDYLYNKVMTYKHAK